MNPWVKQGLLYEHKAGDQLKLASHAANPLPVRIDNSLYRCFFSARDAQNRSSIGAVDIDFNSMNIVKRHSAVFFQHGDEHSFYSHGVSIGNCYKIDGQRYMLFMGWQNPSDAHWYGQIGRLNVAENLNLSLDSSTPFLALDDEDPISLSYPWVIYHSGRYRMWYGSTVSWDAGNGEMLHIIKYAESLDGNNWVKHGQAISTQLGVAQAFSRPSVYVDVAGHFHMWFSFRSGLGEPYRIGYCSSQDGYTWSHPRLELSVSKTGWDSDMVEYPFLMKHDNELVMLYNGDGYGKLGFGSARIPIDAITV